MKSISLYAALSLCASTAFAAISDEDQIKAALNDACKAYVESDVEGMMAPLWNDPSFVDFDLSPPRAKGFEQLTKDTVAMKDATEGPAICDYKEIKVVMLAKNIAYSMSILHAGGQIKAGPKMDFTMRSTDIWRKIKGKWKVVHEHNSFPVNPVTGQADLQSAP